jgi:hypothetical protein
MNINAVEVNTLMNQGLQTKGVAESTAVKTDQADVEKVNPVLQKLDSVELGTTRFENIGTYTVDTEKLDQIKQEFSQNLESFKKMVEVMIEKQGKEVSQVLQDLADGKVVDITVDSETEETAKAAISEDGYFGVNKTSDRIVDFAKALCGGDKSKIELLRSAFIEGFESVKADYGGELPDISQQTYDKVMQGFDDWANKE